MGYNINLARKWDKNGNWKGDAVGYSALHRRIESKRGKPKKCEFCKSITSKKYYWANKSGFYKKDLNDWIRLCASCHRIYDNSKKNIYKKICKLQIFNKKCIICEKKFNTTSRYTKTCSQKCRYISCQLSWSKSTPKAKRMCKRCKITFYIPHAWLRKSGNRGVFCSRKCRWSK